jgi:hypothetical protein
MTRGDQNALALVALIVILVAVICFSEVSRSRFATDPRDPRCDTAARYDAMRDGADCS